MAAAQYISQPPFGDPQEWAFGEFRAIERTLSRVVTFLPTRDQSGTSYTVALGDEDYLIANTSGSATTVTIPADSTTNFAIGTCIHLSQEGAGQVTIAGAGGVTLTSRPGLKTAGQYAMATVWKKAANTWRAFGDLTT